MTVSVTLTPDLEARPCALAEDLEDYAEAAEVLQRVRSGQEETMSSKDFWCGLDD